MTIFNKLNNVHYLEASDRCRVLINILDEVLIKHRAFVNNENYLKHTNKIRGFLFELEADARASYIKNKSKIVKAETELQHEVLDRVEWMSGIIHDDLLIHPYVKKDEELQLVITKAIIMLTKAYGKVLGTNITL